MYLFMLYMRCLETLFSLGPCFSSVGIAGRRQQDPSSLNHKAVLLDLFPSHLFPSLCLPFPFFFSFLPLPFLLFPSFPFFSPLHSPPIPSVPCLLSSPCSPLLSFLHSQYPLLLWSCEHNLDECFIIPVLVSGVSSLSRS